MGNGNLTLKLEYIIDNSYLISCTQLLKLIITSFPQTPLRNFRGGHDNAVREVKFSSDGKAVVSYSDDRTVRRWDVATEKQLSSHAEHRDDRVCKRLQESCDFRK